MKSTLYSHWLVFRKIVSEICKYVIGVPRKLYQYCRESLGWSIKSSYATEQFYIFQSHFWILLSKLPRFKTYDRIRPYTTKYDVKRWSCTNIACGDRIRWNTTLYDCPIRPFHTHIVNDIRIRTYTVVFSSYIFV